MPATSTTQHAKFKTQNYTDSPNLHANLILGSFHLLFWLFMHPSAWQNYAARLDPSLPPNFSLAGLTRAQWQNAALQRLLIQGYVIWPAMAGLLVAGILWQKGSSLQSMIVPVFFVVSVNLTLAILIGAIISLAAGISAGLTIALAVGVLGSIFSGFTGTIVTAVAIAFALSAALSAAGNPGPTNSTFSSSRQLGGVVIGITVGVLVMGAIRWGLTSLADVTVAPPGDTGYNLSRMIVVGSSIGVAVGWQRGPRAGLLGGFLGGLAYGIAVLGWKLEWTGLAIGLTSGMLFGTSLGATIVLPYVLANWVAGAWAGAWAASLGSWGRHVVRNNIALWPTLPLGLIAIGLGMTLSWWLSIAFYPLLAAWNLILLRLDEQRERPGPHRLRLHSAFWDEHQRLPLLGLDEHVLLVIERNPTEGQAALDYLQRGRQRWAVQAVQIELQARRLQACQTVEMIGQAQRGLSADPLLRDFSHISQDAQAALNQGTAYHQRLALSAINDRLGSLARELSASGSAHAPRFYAIAVQWQQLVAGRLNQLAEAIEQSQEIDNPYVVGVPLTAQQEIFVGRADIVARIEQLLLDQRHPPLLLYGQRRMGKTSLLRNLGRLLPKTIVPLFVDGQRVALAGDYADFLHNLAREMSRSARQQRQLNLPPLNRQALAASPFTRFNEWLDQAEQTLDAHGFNIALLALDEFEMLDSALAKGRFDETDVLSLLRHMIQHRPHFKVMLAGSHTLDELNRWAGYLINVQVIKIGYLDMAEAAQLIEHPIKNFALRYRPEASRRAQQLTRGHPALVQLLCYELVTLKNEQDAHLRRLAEVSDVEAAAARALASGSFFFTDIAQNQVDEMGSALLRFMATCGEGAVVSKESLQTHGGQTPAEFDQTVQRLLQRDLIEAADGGYRFQVELIRRWFASNF